MGRRKEGWREGGMEGGEIEVGGRRRRDRGGGGREGGRSGRKEGGVQKGREEHNYNFPVVITTPVVFSKQSPWSPNSCPVSAWTSVSFLVM